MKTSWLDKFAEARSEQTKKEVTASKKIKKVASVDEANVIIVNKDLLKTAKENDTVKYHNIIWKVAKASYSDSLGEGVILRRVKPLEKTAEIDTKKVTEAPEYARTDPGDQFDIPVREQEQEKFEAEAVNTENELATENAVDRTTPEGRYTNPIIKSITETPVEEVSEEALPEVVDEPETSDEVSEVPEVTDEQEVSDEEVSVDDKFDDIVDDFDSEEVPVEEVSDVEEVSEVDEEPEVFDDILEDEEEEEKKVAEVEAKRENPILASIKKCK